MGPVAVNTYDRPYAQVICDTTSPAGSRLTTFEVTFHRFVLAEFNTHRVFSRNSASSRAIPAHKMLKRVFDTPAIPLVWPAEQAGMQGGEELDVDTQSAAARQWLIACDNALASAKALIELGVHKSVVNRLLEPFMWQTVIVTSVDYQNYFKLRNSPKAQPEIQCVAKLMKEAYDKSVPGLLQPGEYHLPYISADDFSMYLLPDLIAISVARCARVSYLTHSGVRNVTEDLAMYKRLISADPPHESPLEHVATPVEPGMYSLGNFPGWDQWRHFR